MNISLMVQFDKNWELENRKVHFNTICLIHTARHLAPGSCVISRCRCSFRLSDKAVFQKQCSFI